MKASKVIVMSRDEWNLLDNARRLLDQMSDDLEKMAEADPNLFDLSEESKSAWGALEDYLEEYNRQFIKPEEE